MQDNKNIRPYNHKGLRHGYWETYFDNGMLFYKRYYINFEKYGLEVLYDNTVKLSLKSYYARLSLKSYYAR